MKRFSSSDSLDGLMSICPNATDEGNNPMYMFEAEGCIEESGHVSEKKRRLGVGQVKALEKNFEVENKLEPDRKVKLAEELGLQPRQVAVWFQNRRARWKTKQLERNYGALKANYDALKLNFDRLQHDNESLLKEIRGLKSKLDENGSAEEKMEIATEMENVIINGRKKEEMNWPKFGDLKDGSSDSDSSAILNEENNNCSSPRDHQQQLFDIGEIKESSSNQPQFVKIEEHNFFGEESCTTFFSDDQPPTLQQWYCNDEWN